MGEVVPVEFHIDLQKWIYRFNSMPDITTKRCLETGPTTSQQLHVFTNPSIIATSAVICMRSTTTEGNVIVNYVISKSRVAPIKQTSAPKLDLELATIGAELAGFVAAAMTMNFSSVHFSMDSTATLGWINSDKRQKVFVANRDNKILHNSRVEEWKHIPVKSNPKRTTVATKGCISSVRSSFGWKWSFASQRKAETSANSLESKAPHNTGHQRPCHSVNCSGRSH